MTSKTLPVALSLIVVVGLAGCRGTEPQPRRITLQALEDKIRGGWAGQMIGVSFGAPTEFRSNGKIIENNLNDFMNWTPERVKNAINQDDLYVEMTFAALMDGQGLETTTEQYGEAFKNTQYHLWHANAGARRLLNRGIKAPSSGHPKYNIHANDIDFQIEADFIGLMTPGLPQESNKYCDRVGRVMNHGDGLYGGMFVAGMYSAAFFEDDVREVVEQGLACIPVESGYARVIRDVLSWSADHPEDWKKAWSLLEEKWNKDDSCPDGALRAFNIDARLNGAYVALGLLYGNGDFSSTLEISTRSGQDSDCNPASAAGILGVMKGYSAIPEKWTRGISEIENTRFQYTDYSFNEIVESTRDRALKVVESAGGRMTSTELWVPVQPPLPPPLEQWSMGLPQEIVETTDMRWKWSGEWLEEPEQRGGRTTHGPGAEAVLDFSGTALAVIGSYSQDGGRADVFLDGEKAGEIDAYIVENTHDNSLWHVSGLDPGTHTLRLVTRDEADPRSSGRKVVITRAVIYRGD